MDKKKLGSVLLILLIVMIPIIFSFCFIRSCHQVIDKAGGLRELFIQEGKEIRSIYKDISDDSYTKQTN